MNGDSVMIQSRRLLPESDDNKTTYLDVFHNSKVKKTPSEFAIEDKFLNQKYSPATKDISADFQNQFLVSRVSSLPIQSKNYTRRDTAILDSANIGELAITNSSFTSTGMAPITAKVEILV